MRIKHSILRSLMFNRGSQLGGLFILAMALGGPQVRKDFYQMSAELTRVESRRDFAEWLVKSHYRMIDLIKIDWKPISVFPKEARQFK